MSKLTMDQQELVETLVEDEALKFGDFTLKSGRKSPFFVNLGGLSSGTSLWLLAINYGERIMEKYGYDDEEEAENEQFKIDVLFGPAYKGIPLAAIVSCYLSSEYGINVRYCANRKEVKDHGEGGDLVGGPINEGDRVLIIEDVTTSGKSIDEVMPILEKYKAQVVGEIIAFDRQEKGQDTEEFALLAIERKYGFPVHAVLGMDQVIDYLYDSRDPKSRTVITDEIRQKLTAYYEEYGGKVLEE